MDGQVFILNPNGILFGAGSKVNVGGILASTLELSDSDFLSRQYRLRPSVDDGDAGGTSGIHIEGTIWAEPGGYIALVFPQIDSQGALHAPSGGVAMAAGDVVRLELGGPIGVEVEASAIGAQIFHGGRILLTAEAAGALLDTVIGMDGVIRARTIDDASGTIRLLGAWAAGQSTLRGNSTHPRPTAVTGASSRLPARDWRSKRRPS